MTEAFLNRVATVVPPHDVHEGFLGFARRMLNGDNRRLALFNRMAERSGISHRYSFFKTEGDSDVTKFYRPGVFPNTAARMKIFEKFSPQLAAEAAEALLIGEDRSRISHLIVTSCTGFFAPGIDLQVVARCGLHPGIERTFIGFMGCYAAINALKLARHIVRSEPASRVMVMNLELCTLHLHETTDLEEILSFLLFGDGCAAALVSSDPIGARMDSFRSVLMPDTDQLIRWNIREQGFDMVLAGGVPGAIRNGLTTAKEEILQDDTIESIDLWAVHPGGRTVIDAVENALVLPSEALIPSRGVLNDFGNMSSGTVMFVLARLMREAKTGARGCAMAFGPGLVAETMRFSMAT